MLKAVFVDQATKTSSFECRGGVVKVIFAAAWEEFILTLKDVGRPMLCVMSWRGKKE